MKVLTQKSYCKGISAYYLKSLIMVEFPGMNIGIFCPKDSVSAAKIKSEAEAKGHICRRMRLNDLFVTISTEGLIVEHRKFDLNDFDVLIFRKINPFEGEIAAVLAKQFAAKGKRVIDRETIIDNNILCDFEKLASSHLPILKRVIAPSIKSSRDVLMDFEHPVIVKPLDLPIERYTFSEDWTESFDIVRTEKSKKYEIIQATDTKEFLRVYLVGYHVVGTLKKTILDEDNKLNFSKKTKAEKFELDANLIQLCENAAKNIGYEICSIDLVQHDEEWKIIDLDRSPKFSSFNSIIGLKFEEKIVEYLNSN